MESRSMSSCDFSTYETLRNATTSAANDAKAACVAEQTARDAVQDAEATLADAVAAKEAAYDAWETAEQAENLAAKDLGNPAHPQQQQQG